MLTNCMLLNIIKFILRYKSLSFTEIFLKTLLNFEIHWQYLTLKNTHGQNFAYIFLNIKFIKHFKINYTKIIKLFN